MSGGKGFWQAWLIRILLAAVVVGIFTPLFSAGFLQWDDGLNLFDNPRMLHPSWSNCAYYWSHESLDLYIPVTYTVWSGLSLLAREPRDASGSPSLSPRVFHVANVLFHALAVIVVFNVIRIWSGNLAAAAAAMLFAVHPLQVEAVGWVCGMKDVLAGLFGLLAVWQYVLHAVAPARRISPHYVLASVAFVAALLSKPTAVVTPLVCAIVAVGIVRIPMRRVLLEMAPWLCVSIVVGVVAARVQTDRRLVPDVRPWERPLIAADALAFYVGKLAWPVELCLDYGRSPQMVLNPPNRPAYWTWIVPVALTGLLWWKAKKWPGLAVAALVSLAALLPVLGLLKFDFQTVSTVTDHYFYFAMLGPAIAVAAFLQKHRTSALAIGVTASVLTVLAALCHAQTFTWISEPVAFRHAVDVNPSSSVGHGHLWKYAMDRQDYASAESEAKIIISCYPNDPIGYIDLGDTLAETDRWQNAAESYERAMRVEPKDPIPYNNLATLYGSHGDPQRAIPLYRKALELKPDYAEAQTGLASAQKAVKPEVK